MDAQLANLMDVFRTNYLVQSLPEKATQEIADMARYRVALSGETLVEKGEKGIDVYVILEGQVNLYGPDGDKIGVIEPPAILGEIALVDNQERSINAVCVGLVKCAVLPGGDLRKYMSKNKDYGFIMLSNLSRVLSSRLRKTNAILLELMGKTQDLWRHVT